jgi:hypothetical protein
MRHLRGLFQANVLALLLKERMISSELVERMREWRHSGFHAAAPAIHGYRGHPWPSEAAAGGVAWREG